MTNGIRPETNGTARGITLLPCPLCGSHAHFGEDCSSYNPMRHYAVCDNLDCRLFELPRAMFETPEEAADDWNALPRWDVAKERIAKLTVERDAYFEMVKRVQADCDARDELIRDMMPFMCEDDGIEGIETRIRELGIEVNDEG